MANGAAWKEASGAYAVLRAKCAARDVFGERPPLCSASFPVAPLGSQQDGERAVICRDTSGSMAQIPAKRPVASPDNPCHFAMLLVSVPQLCVCRSSGRNSAGKVSAAAALQGLCGHLDGSKPRGSRETASARDQKKLETSGRKSLRWG